MLAKFHYAMCISVILQMFVHRRLFLYILLLVAICVLNQLFICNPDHTVNPKNVPKRLQNYFHKSLNTSLTLLKQWKKEFWFNQQQQISKIIKIIEVGQHTKLFKIRYTLWRKKYTKRKRSGIVSYIRE